MIVQAHAVTVMANTRPVLLAIDDEPGVIAMRALRARPGVRSDRTGGRQMLTELPTLKPDVALVDLRLPEADLLRRVREVLDARAG